MINSINEYSYLPKFVILRVMTTLLAGSNFYPCRQVLLKRDPTSATKTFISASGFKGSSEG